MEGAWQENSLGSVKKLPDGSFVDEDDRCFILKLGERHYHDGEKGWDPSKPYQQVTEIGVSRIVRILRNNRADVCAAARGESEVTLNVL